MLLDKAVEIYVSALENSLKYTLFRKAVYADISSATNSDSNWELSICGRRMSFLRNYSTISCVHSKVT